MLGSLFGMAKGPAEFFVHCYRTYGPVCRLRILGQQYVLISGVEAANFMGTRAGKDCLRSKEFWEGLLGEYGARRMLTGEDGDSHRELRDIMRKGYSRESIKGRYNELVAITDGSLARDWPVGKEVPVVEAMQYMVVDQLGTILTGAAPLEYVKDIRTAIIYILNVLVTRQRPRILLKRPEYRKAMGKVMELGNQMIKDAKSALCRDPAGRSQPDRRHHGRAHRNAGEDAGKRSHRVADRPLRCRPRHRRQHHRRRRLLRTQASGSQSARAKGSG